MGQIGGLNRFNKDEINKFEKSKTINWKNVKESVDVDKFWEPIMFIFGNGNLGGEPFINLFMAKNCLYESPDQNKWNPSIRYHDDKEIEEYLKEFENISEEVIRKRIDIEKINRKVMYQIQESNIETIVENCINIINLFKKAKKEKDVIVSTIG